MKYRLGIDVGTASVGLVCYKLDGKNNPTGIVHHSVRIFPEPLLPAKTGGVGQPKKAARRLARQARRQHQRRSSRLRQVAQLAFLLELDPKSVSADTGQTIHNLRAAAAKQVLSLEDVYRVLLKLVKRRGYSGGFRVKGEGKEKGQVQTGISALEEEMTSTGSATLGDYLAKRFQSGQSLKLKEAGLYASREIVQQEFDAIWTEQSKHHDLLNSNHEGVPLRQMFFDAIFYQRPLKTPAPLVGHCELEPSLRRAPAAHPMAQDFRIEKQIADLRWGVGRSTDELGDKQKTIIRDLLQQKAEVTFEVIYKALDKAGCPKPLSQWLNLSRGGRERLSGNKTTAVFHRLKVLSEWEAMSPVDQTRVINLLADMGSPEVFDDLNWDQKLLGENGAVRTLSPASVSFINQLVDSGKFDRLSKMGFDSGRSAYSVKALTTLTEEMRTQGLDEYGAVTKRYPRHGTTTKSGLPELLSHTTTGNTVIDVALRQVRREVNQAINALGGPPAEAIIELTREMSAGMKRREDQTKAMRRNERARREAKAEIEQYGAQASESAVRRYLLWTEQDQQWCPYCDKTISLGQALHGGETHYEHIVPRALTRIGKQRDFMVLAHNNCNSEKADRTPWEAWGDGRDPERWAIVEQRATAFQKKRAWGKAKQLLVREYESEVLDMAAIQGFSERQFHEGSWIAKLTAQWMRSVCPQVSVSRGMLTAHLRRIWGLETVIPEARYRDGLVVKNTDGGLVSEKSFNTYKPYWEGHRTKDRPDFRIDKRTDHRHHLIDAIAIGLSTPGLYQKMGQHYKKVTESGAMGMRLSVEPPHTQLRQWAVDAVAACNLSHRPDPWPAGPFFLEQPLGMTEVEGKQRYSQRVPLGGLAAKADKADTVRKRINTILSEETRTIVLQEFEARLKDGMTPAEALTKDITVPGFNTVIKRVKVEKDGDVKKGVVVNHVRRDGTTLHKWLVPEGYAWLDVDFSDPKKPIYILVSLQQAAKQEFRPPAASITRFRKGDTVRDGKDNRLFVIRQIKANGPTLLLSSITESTVFAQIDPGNGKRTVMAVQLRRLTII